ncbi:hypothetical protein AQUCO_00100028v1 [Aquilegia coerulea]|uniref:MYB transcription factor n=1 Tax=Aquilegia coerulea TaxID=218851 RepID=A0A2G5F8D7_AQUCA|nr:hypothetical protein AQUCO_00100028v1 [Aquilegia coerulea]
MGAPKQKWTAEEEDALRAGVTKHGTGKWKNIQKDPEFSHYLAARSNIDLKDKWRNMSVSASGQGSRDKVRTPKMKALPPIPPVQNPTPISTLTTTPTPALPSSNSKTPTSNALVLYEPADTLMDSSKSAAEGKTKYNTMIFDAITGLKDPTGSDIGAIMNFIEAKQVVPPNFRRVLSSKLRRLVSQDKLEKVQNNYKIKKDGSFGPRIGSNQKQKDDQHSKQSPSIANKIRLEEIENAASSAAYMIADAENKAFMASEAVKEAERVARMVEESDSMLQLAKNIYERCTQGEIVLMA